jgi:hypothetical protein
MIAGRPSPRRRQEAPQSGGVKPLRVAQPVGRGATRSRPLPASMASGVDRIAAPGGTFGHGASGNAAGGLRAPQTPARYLNKKISRPFDGFSLSTNGLGRLRPLPFKTLLPHEPLCGGATTPAGSAPERARSGSRVARPVGPSVAGTLLPQRRYAPPIMSKSRSDFPLTCCSWEWCSGLFPLHRRFQTSKGKFQAARLV